MREPLIPRTPTVAKINVTPIIDVALVLVIILLITAPMLSVTNMDLELPRAHARGPEDYRRVTITLGRDGRTAIDDQEIVGGDLSRHLHSRLAEHQDDDMLVVVRADAGIPYSVIRRVLQEARSAGAGCLAIGTRQGQGGEP